MAASMSLSDAPDLDLLGQVAGFVEQHADALGERYSLGSKGLNVVGMNQPA